MYDLCVTLVELLLREELGREKQQVNFRFIFSSSTHRQLKPYRSRFTGEDHPDTIDLIEEELEEIRFERFRVCHVSFERLFYSCRSNF